MSETRSEPGAAASSCDVSDACDELGIPAVRSGALRPLWPQCPAVSGRLKIVQLVPGEGSPLAELLDVLSGAGGQLVFVDLAGHGGLQCWGTVLATVARRHGALGAVVNGAARDIEGLEGLGFPSYARGVYPGAIRGRLQIASVDEPVMLDGQTVAPGDFAVADKSGIVILDDERSDDVLAAAERRQAEEERRLRRVAGGGDPRDLLPAA